MKTRYKFLNIYNGKIKSVNGDCVWKINEWKHEDKIDMCHSGFHSSKKIWEAFSYVQGNLLAEVECKGESIKNDDKEVYQDMRIIKAWKWQKKDSVALSIFSAELCLKNFEKLYPEDKRPREAIEAAKKWLLEPTKENESAARSAELAARSAAESAELAARSAAESAELAARSAAWSAESAESAAELAAWSAAWSAAKKKIFTAICSWFDRHLKELEIYE